MSENNFSYPEETTTDIKRQLTTVTPLSKYLALALFIILPFVGFWLGVEHGRENVNAPESVSFPKLASTTDVSRDTNSNELADDIELDSNDDWLVYSNEMHGFSFSFPSNWIITEDLSDTSSDYVHVELRECTREKSVELRLDSGSCNYFSIQAQSGQQYDTIDDWYDAYEKDEYTMFLRCNNELTEFAEVPAYECYAKEGAQPGELIHYQILHNNSWLEILTESQPSQVMQDITQTFQFAEGLEDSNANDGAIEASTEKWKLYRNDDFGFEFKYPDLGIMFETETKLNELDDSVTNIEFKGNSKFDNHFGTLFDLFVYPNPDRKTIKQWFNNHSCDEMLLETGYIEVTTINGHEALVSNDTPLPSEYFDECGPVSSLKFINLEDKQIIISLSYPYQVIGPDDFGFDSYDQVEEFLNQALSTFESIPE